MHLNDERANRIRLKIADHTRRHRVLPLVCKAWAAACAGPSPLWRQVAVDVRHYSERHASTVDARLLAAWLTARAPCVRFFSLRCSAGRDCNRGMLVAVARHLATNAGLCKPGAAKHPLDRVRTKLAGNQTALV